MSGLTKFDIVKAEINLRNEVERMFGKIKWDTPTDAYDAAVSDEANMNVGRERKRPGVFLAAACEEDISSKLRLWAG